MDGYLPPGDITSEAIRFSIEMQIGRSISEWRLGDPEVVYIEGSQYDPHPQPGVLFVDGEPHYSAAWL